MSDGNPSGRSPAKVAVDPDYVVQQNYARGQYWPSASDIVVLHKATGTYWRAIYAERDDDNDYERAATWKRVRPVERIAFEEVS